MTNSAKRERRGTVGQEKFNRMFAELMAPEEARYVWVCQCCGTAHWREIDSKYVKLAREGDLECGCDNETEIEMVVDPKR